MKKVIISNHSEVTAKGKLNSRKCKPVICIDTGVVYTSVTDAAMANGTTSSAISGSYTGKSKTANGKRFCLVSNMSEHYEEIAERMREMYAVYAKAEEERAEKERIEKAKAEYSQACAQYNKARESFENARAELVALGITEL